jgi:O-antigen/teichoic acid export membrane protein
VMTSPQIVGWYAVPTQLFSSLLFVPVILSQAWFPRIAAAFSGGPERFRAIARPAVELVLLISLPLAAGSALTAPNLIGALYGGTFAGSVPSLVILGLALPMTYLNIMGNQVVIATDRMVAWTKLMGVAALLNPAINLAMISVFQRRFHNGATGAALTLLLTEIFQGLVALYLMRGILDGNSLRKLSRALAATLGMSVVVWLLGPVGLYAQVPAGAASFAGLAIVFRVLNRDEWRELGDLLLRLRGKLPGRLRRGGAVA